MDRCTRRIVGFGVHRGVVDDVALCRMFNQAMGRQPPPTDLSSDHDPLYRFHQWQANLRILDVEVIKTVPYVPLHPFVERLIGTIRRECLDRTLFWTTADLDVTRHDRVYDAGSQASPSSRVVDRLNTMHVLILTETVARMRIWTGLDHRNDASVQAWLQHDGQFATDTFGWCVLCLDQT
jgi:hypothetical protein